MNIIYWKSDKYWLGKLLEHPEIMTQGETLDELEKNIKDAYMMMAMDGWGQISTMAQIPIKFSDIKDAFDFVSFGQPMEHEAYLCLETGEIFWHSEVGDNEEELPEDIDDDKYIAIPHKNDLDLGKRLVLSFAKEYLPESMDKVYEIFSRHGAYARFKDLLEYRDLLQQWYEYEEKASDQALHEWCGLNGIKTDG